MSPVTFIIIHEFYRITTKDLHSLPQTYFSTSSFSISLQEDEVQTHYSWHSSKTPTMFKIFPFHLMNSFFLSTLFYRKPPPFPLFAQMPHFWILHFPLRKANISSAIPCYKSACNPAKTYISFTLKQLKRCLQVCLSDFAYFPTCRSNQILENPIQIMKW